MNPKTEKGVRQVNGLYWTFIGCPSRQWFEGLTFIGPGRAVTSRSSGLKRAVVYEIAKRRLNSVARGRPQCGIAVYAVMLRLDDSFADRQLL